MSIKRNAIWVLMIEGLLLLGLASCVPTSSSSSSSTDVPPSPTQIAQPTVTQPADDIRPTSERGMVSPGELVDYIAQDGDTLINLAVRFNTTAKEILEANPQIPKTVTTMPQGMPMQIPTYYRTFWGTQYQILPNNQFVNGPSAVTFDTATFLADYDTWIKDVNVYIEGHTISGVEFIDHMAYSYSVHPKVILALLENQAGVLSDSFLDEGEDAYLLDFVDPLTQGFSSQLNQALALLNEGYYLYQNGLLIEFDRPNGYIERPDPAQNAGTVALQYYFAEMLETDEEYQTAIGPDGFAKTYQDLFGDPWQEDAEPIYVANVTQPHMKLPFRSGEIWNFTGAPHATWGTGEPFGALDFAPPLTISGCVITDRPVVAVADGTVVRTDIGLVMLDLDGDGDERTGWNVFYFHIRDKVPVGTVVKAGDFLGYPSCEGGRSTGTHVHIARKYNGEWINAAGTLAFNMEDWIPDPSLGTAYSGTMTRFGITITAVESGGLRSQILSRE